MSPGALVGWLVFEEWGRRGTVVTVSSWHLMLAPHRLIVAGWLRRGGGGGWSFRGLCGPDPSRRDQMHLPPYPIPKPWELRRLRAGIRGVGVGWGEGHLEFRFLL